MALFARHLRDETPRLLANQVMLRVIGRRDRLPHDLVQTIAESEAATAACDGMTLRIAVDYSARRAIEDGALIPDVDLLIRTGGEQRLSDFLLWESAYAELYFTPVMWPDWSAADLEVAVREFQSRERRFGTVPQVEAAAGPLRLVKP
jgi:undecaprenyl diphosphate synthase